VALGPALGGLVLLFGPVAVPIALGVAVLALLLRDPFRLLLVLVATWPAGTLYLRYRLVPGMPELAYERLLAALIAGALLAAACLGRRRLPRIGVAVGAYVALQLVSIVWADLSGDLARAERAAFLNAVLLPVLLSWATRALVESPRHLQALLHAILAASVLVCVSGLYERTRPDTENPFPVAAHNEAGDTRYADVPDGRASGVMGNPAVYGAVLALGAAACLAGLLQSPRKRTKAMLGATLALLLYGVFVSFTRSAWISTLAALLVAPLFLQRRWTAALPLLAAAALALPWLSEAALTSRLVEDRISTATPSPDASSGSCSPASTSCRSRCSAGDRGRWTT
jgi:hypothetical protein